MTVLIDTGRKMMSGWRRAAWRSPKTTVSMAMVGAGLLILGAASARAQTATPIEQLNAQTAPRTDRGLAEPPAGPVRNGPLAAWANDMAARGFSFDVNMYDFYQANPTAGLRPGNQSNANYFVLSMSADMQKIAGIAGGTITFTQNFYTLVRNLNMALDIGDTTIGYQPPYTPNSARLAVLTYQQKLFDDRLVVEFGRTHPDRYYGLPPCNSNNSCFQDLFYFNAGFPSPGFGVWGANIAYTLSPRSYIQAGAFAVNPNGNFLGGYDWGYETLSGVTVMSEIGYRTDYTQEAYPGRVSLTGFYNTADHEDNFKTVTGASKGLNPGTPVLQKSGTSGIVLTGTQTVWRADGGAETNPTPTSIAVFTGTGYAFDPTVPIRFNSFAGILLQAPDQSRPNDTYSLKANWQRVAADYAAFLSDANLVSGGSGAPFSRDKLVFEVNAHFDLGRGVILEPVVQYLVNSTSFWNPYTARRPQDGFYGGFTLIVPIGTFLGLVPG